MSKLSVVQRSRRAQAPQLIPPQSPSSIQASVDYCLAERAKLRAAGIAVPMDPVPDPTIHHARMHIGLETIHRLMDQVGTEQVYEWVQQAADERGHVRNRR